MLRSHMMNISYFTTGGGYFIKYVYDSGSNIFNDQLMDGVSGWASK